MKLITLGQVKAARSGFTVKSFFPALFVFQTTDIYQRWILHKHLSRRASQRISIVQKRNILKVDVLIILLFFNIQKSSLAQVLVVSIIEYFSRTYDHVWYDDQFFCIITNNWCSCLSCIANKLSVISDVAQCNVNLF